MANRCPFCGNYAYTQSVGDAYQMDCRYCDVQVEITKRAYAARCPDPVGVLEYIAEKMKSSTRPRVDLADMKRTRQQSASLDGETMSVAASETSSDVLTTAAKAIGTTLAKIAVKTGIAKPRVDAPPAPAVRKKAAPRKKSAVAKKAPRKSASPRKRTPSGSKRNK